MQNFKFLGVLDIAKIDKMILETGLLQLIESYLYHKEINK